jgi:hypothetical protein
VGAATRASAAGRFPFYGAEIERSEQDNARFLREHLGKLGWIEGRNLPIDLR